MNNRITLTFPRLVEEELVYGAWSRYYHIMGQPKVAPFLKDLLGKSQINLSIDLPTRLDAFNAIIPSWYGYDSEYFIDWHTLFPYYSVFLPIERTHPLREEMKNGSQSSIHAKAGLVAANVYRPTKLRRCPICACEDEKRYGISICYRLPQLPGVEVCPIHNVFLQETEIPTRELKNFYTMPNSTKQTRISKIKTNNGFHKRLIEIANDSLWLLHQTNLYLSPTGLREKYQLLLKANKLLTYDGRTRLGVLVDQLKQSYPHDFLDLCGFKKGMEKGWFFGILHELRQVHPLKHIILANHLGVSFQELAELTIAVDEEGQPFGDGPWICRNPVCPHFQNQVITKCEIKLTKRKGKWKGKFRCTCGYTYSIVRNSLDDNDDYLGVEDFGHLWKDALKNMWVQDMSLNEIAEQLGVWRVTVKYQAVLLGLSQRPFGKWLKLPEIRRDPDKTGEIHKVAWLSTYANNPNASISQLRELEPNALAWLREYDRKWLDEHSPSVKLRYRQQPKDWQKIDTQLAEKVKSEGQKLLTSSRRPVRITASRICKNLNIGSGYIKRNSEKLPKTVETLKRFEESYFDVAIRRLRWTAEQNIGKSLSRNQFIRLAGIFPYSKTPEFVRAIDEAMQYMLGNHEAA